MSDRSHMMDGARQPGPVLLALILFALIAGLIAIDLVSDFRAGGESLHLGLEAVAMFLAVAGGIHLWVRTVRANRAARRLRRDLQEARAAAERWRSENRELLAGLGASIDAELDRWELTPAEREVAWLLLKGLSHKEAAALRGTSERTVRRQANAVYKKAGLGGRAELAAYFLEDLLVLREGEGASSRAAPPAGTSG